MCGITGIYHFTARPIVPATLEAMTAQLYHRGPDDFGYAFFNPAGDCIRQGRTLPNGDQPHQLALGHRRLAIIDLSPTGGQPMTDVTGRLWITYNGEIYNYLELRKELLALGYGFRGTCDTEVILNAYRHWGQDCIYHFNGMWAFALWDKEAKTLFCCRDRLGIKPFYFYRDDRVFIFGSEIKAVLAGLDKKQFEVNRPYLARFIKYGLKDDSDQTCFEKISQLPPGHSLEIKAGRFQCRRYWQLTPSADQTVARADIDQNDLTDRFRSLLADAVRFRLRADVPVGVCLSGGLDSSSIAALAVQASTDSVFSFTTEYSQPEFAEGHYARQVAAAFKTKAHYISPASGGFPDFIQRFTWVHDEPCPGPGPFSQWHVMNLASQHVKVVLEGQGADELLGGYLQYFDYYLADLLRDAMNPKCRFTFGNYLAALHAVARHNGVPPRRYLLNSLKMLARSALPQRAVTLLHEAGFPARFFSRRGVFDNLIHPDFGSQVSPLGQAGPASFHGMLNDVLCRELTRDNLPMLLNYDDRTSMAFSIESRVPFLDYRLVEFVAALPGWTKIHNAQTKYPLRQAMKNILPDSIVNRPDKKGFPTPFTHWLKDELRDYALDIFNSQAFRQRNIFQSDKILSLYQEHCDGKADHAWMLWRVLNIEVWQRLFFNDFDAVCREQLEKVRAVQPTRTGPTEQCASRQMDDPDKNLVMQTGNS
jgi:asparagine synthase (glutamine-hydrolysing)